MKINNVEASVNSTAKQLFYSYIPLGSDYVIFNSSTGATSTNTSYTMYLRRVGSDQYEIYNITRTGTNNVYELSQSSGGDFPEDGWTVENPYYCFSNVQGCGIHETLPVAAETGAVMDVVICCLLILCVVFGGISLWRKRRF